MDGTANYTPFSPGVANANVVEFKREAHYNEAESKKLGYQVYDDREVAYIHIPDGKSVFVKVLDFSTPEAQLTTNLWLQDYMPQYNAWKAGQDSRRAGTPLEALVWLEPSWRAMIEDGKIFTVEQLAGLDDAALGRFGPGLMEIRDKARIYLQAMHNAAPVAQLEAKVDQLSNVVEQAIAAQRAAEERAAILEAQLAAKPVAPRGRPKAAGAAE